jgi:DNA gyrase/topoisomerase IV subunit A
VNFLNTKVYRFAGYEVKSFEDEYQEKTAEAEILRTLLADPDEIQQVVVQELRAAKKRYALERKTLVEVSLPDFEYDATALIVDVDA